MPSDKPQPPSISWKERKKQLPQLGVDRLANLLWDRSQADEILNKILTVATTIQFGQDNLDDAQSAIDRALHFPDFIRHTERGHDLILDEIRVTLEQVVFQSRKDFALRAGEYALKKGREVSENFQEDWEWSEGLKRIENWICKTRSE